MIYIPGFGFGIVIHIQHFLHTLFIYYSMLYRQRRIYKTILGGSQHFTECLLGVFVVEYCKAIFGVEYFESNYSCV